MNDAPRHISGGRSAFTLLELLVVIIIIAVISMSIVPVYIFSMNGIEMRNARNDLIAAIRYAQEMAVRESREYRITFDMDENSYHIERLAGLDNEEKVFEPAESLLGEGQRLPDFLTLTKVKGVQNKYTRDYYIRCLPNGTSDKATIELRDTRARNIRYVLEVAGPLGQVSMEEHR